MVTIDTPEFITFLEGCNKIVSNYMDTQFPNLPKTSVAPIQGRRYIKLVIGDVNGDHKSAYGFVDMTNGDVLKAASWKAPAKHTRGNILSDDNGLGCINPHGVNYL